MDPDDLKSAWNFQERVRALKGELTKPDDVALAYELLERSLKPQETNQNVIYRNAVLIQMIQFSQLDLTELTKLGLAGMKVLPGVDNGKPSYAMLKAIAKVPKTRHLSGLSAPTRRSPLFCNFSRCIPSLIRFVMTLVLRTWSTAWGSIKALPKVPRIQSEWREMVSALAWGFLGGLQS